MPISISGDGSIGSLSATEMGYLDGVTSAVQTQINSKASSTSPTIDSATLNSPSILSSGANPKFIFRGDGSVIEGLTNSFGIGMKINFGSIPWGALSGTYVHIKLSMTRYSSAMIGFSLYGFGYSSACIVSHMTVYTYSGQATPYSPTYRNLGNVGGFANCYYSSGTENLVLVIDKQGSGYTGGYLEEWGIHNNVGPETTILAMAGSNNTSGVY